MAFSRCNSFTWHFTEEHLQIKMAYKDAVSLDRKFFIPRLLAACTIILANSILIYALRRRNKLRVITFKFIYVLSIADVINGLSVITGNVVIEQVPRKYYKMAKNVVRAALYPLSVFTILMILLIAIDRYLHMTRIHSYRLIMTHKRANILMLSCALTSMAIVCILGSSYLSATFHAVFSTTMCVLGLACIIVVLVLYYRALKSVRNSVHNSAFTDNINIRNAGKEGSKAVFFILTCLLITVTPTFICSPLSLYIPSQEWTLLALYTAKVTFYFNSTLNAVIIICFSRDLRNCIRQLFSHQNTVTWADSVSFQFTKKAKITIETN